jgi:hypothetical protein
MGLTDSGDNGGTPPSPTPYSETILFCHTPDWRWRERKRVVAFVFLVKRADLACVADQ